MRARLFLLFWIAGTAAIEARAAKTYPDPKLMMKDPSTFTDADKRQFQNDYAECMGDPQANINLGYQFTPTKCQKYGTCDTESDIGLAEAAYNRENGTANPTDSYSSHYAIISRLAAGEDPETLKILSDRFWVDSSLKKASVLPFEEGLGAGSDMLMHVVCAGGTCPRNVKEKLNDRVVVLYGLELGKLQATLKAANRGLATPQEMQAVAAAVKTQIQAEQAEPDRTAAAKVDQTKSSFGVHKIDYHRPEACNPGMYRQMPPEEYAAATKAYAENVMRISKSYLCRGVPLKGASNINPSLDKPLYTSEDGGKTRKPIPFEEIGARGDVPHAMDLVGVETDKKGKDLSGVSQQLERGHRQDPAKKLLYIPIESTCKITYDAKAILTPRDEARAQMLGNTQTIIAVAPNSADKDKADAITYGPEQIRAEIPNGVAKAHAELQKIAAEEKAERDKSATQKP